MHDLKLTIENDIVDSRRRKMLDEPEPDKAVGVRTYARLLSEVENMRDPPTDLPEREGASQREGRREPSRER